MAHFAEIDDDNIVLRVLVVSDDDEHRGQEFLADDLGLGGTWIQTSYNTHGGVHRTPDGVPDGGTPFRYNFAGPGSTWDEANDAFIAPQPHASWSLDANFLWQPPVPQPDFNHYWDEDTTSWVEIPLP